MKLRHLRYRLLSHITFGKMKQHYKRKWKEVKLKKYPVASKEINRKNVYNLDQKNLNIAIKLEGGLGDFIIAANFLYKFSEKFKNENVRIDIFVSSKIDASNALFFNRKFFSNLYCSPNDIGLKDERYDLYILILRKTYILHAKRNKIYKYSPSLFDLVQSIEKDNAIHKRLFDLRPFCDGQAIITACIKNHKRYQEADIDEFLQLSSSFDFIPELSNVCFPNLNVNSEKFISIHRGVDVTKTSNSVKQWPVAYYNILISKIKTEYPNLKIIQLGASRERCPIFNNIDVDLVGKTNLEEIKVILKNSLLHIDGEGGMVHLRHALRGGKSLVIFGPTSADFYGYPENVNITGSGCLKSGCEWLTEKWQERCARGYGCHPCMYSITPEKVFDEFKKNMEF